jgi:hypothetical protein
MAEGRGRAVPASVVAPLVLSGAALAVASCHFAALEARFGVRFVEEGQTWTPGTVASVTRALELLPAEVRARLGNPGLGPLLILSNETGTDVTGWSPFGRAANYYANHKGYNEIVLYPDQSVFTVLHELGHAYQLRNVPPGRVAWVYLDPEFRDFMAAAGWSLESSPEDVRASFEAYQVRCSYRGTFTWTGLSSFDPLEDYANSFAMVFWDPARLRELSPERYGWMAVHLPGVQGQAVGAAGVFP